MVQPISTDQGSVMSCCSQAFLVRMMILVSERMVCQLSILTLESPIHPKTLILFDETASQNKPDIKDMRNEGKLRVRSKDPLLSAKLWGQRLQPGGATWITRIPLKFHRKKTVFLFQTVTFPRLWQDSLPAVWVNYQSATALQPLQAAGCCHTGECSFAGPCTTSAGDLMALGKFVERLLTSGSPIFFGLWCV